MSERPPVVVPVRLEGGLADRFSSLAGLEGSFFLDSVTNDRKEGRYSFAGFSPVHTISSTGGFVTIDGRTVIDDPLRALKRFIMFARSIDAEDGYLPFMGGLVGYIGSEWGNDFGTTTADSDIPDLSFGLYDTVVTYDHLEECAFISSFGLKPDGSTDISLARSRAERLAALLGAPATALKSSPGSYPPLSMRHPVISSITKDSFISGVKVLKKEEHLPLFARRFESPTHRPPWSIYLDIRRENQAAYAAYLNCGRFHVLSSSRTRLIKIHNDVISVKPTKGSAARSEDPDTDTKRMNDLRYDPEIQYSHRYIVSDLIRNLARVCDAGTIDVDDVAKIESDARAHHLVSSVRGVKSKGATTLDCVLSVMQALAEARTASLLQRLETVPRNVYTGTIGFIGVNGASEFNLAFRTMILRDNIGSLHSGAEISRTTDPEEAFENTEKAAGRIFSLIG